MTRAGMPARTENPDTSRDVPRPTRAVTPTGSDPRERSRLLSFEGARNRLVALVLLVGLGAMEAERSHDRRVLDGEEDRLSVDAGVLVPGPCRDHEEVPLSPVEALPVDHGAPLPLEHEVHGAPGLAVRLRADAGTEELDPACDGRH